MRYIPPPPRPPFHTTPTCLRLEVAKFFKNPFTYDSVCAAFAYATAAIAPTMDIANCCLLTVPTILLYGCGYMLRWNAIPRYVLW